MFNTRVFNFEVENVFKNFASSISFVVFWKESASGTYLEYFTSVLNGLCDSENVDERDDGGKSLILMEAVPYDFKRTPSIRFKWNSLIKFPAEKLNIFEVPAKPLPVKCSNPQSSVVLEENLAINCCGHFCVFCCTPVETYLETHKTWVWTIKSEKFRSYFASCKNSYFNSRHLFKSLLFFLSFLGVPVH